MCDEAILCPVPLNGKRYSQTSDQLPCVWHNQSGVFQAVLPRPLRGKFFFFEEKQDGRKKKTEKRKFTGRPTCHPWGAYAEELTPFLLVGRRSETDPSWLGCDAGEYCGETGENCETGVLFLSFLFSFFFLFLKDASPAGWEPLEGIAEIHRI